MKKRVRKLKEDLCRVVGHEDKDGVCSRCGKDLPTKRVVLDTWPINSKPAIKWNELKYRKYDLLDRAKQRMKADLNKQIEKKFLDDK